jgi:hypothetical protein
VKSQNPGFTQVTEEDIAHSLLGTDKAGIFQAIEAGIEQEKDPSRKVLSGHARSAPREWTIEAEGSQGKATLGAEDCEVGLRAAWGLPLSVAQTTVLRERRGQGIDLASPSILQRFREEGRKAAVARIERGVVAEASGFSPHVALALNERAIWSDAELQAKGLTAPQLAEWVKRGFLEKHTQWTVDEQARSVKAAYSYSLGRHGAFAGASFVQDQGVPREAIRAHLFVKVRRGATVELRVKDFEIAQRLAQGSPIPDSQKARLQYLRDQGIKVESPAFRTRIAMHPVWTRTVQKIERQVWLEKQGIDPEILVELNRYKQVLREDLASMGFRQEHLDALVSRGAIRRESMVIAPHGNDPRSVEFYSLRASGQWAGVEFLVDSGMKRSDIQKWPQARLDLLKHDLYVPRAARAVVLELESKGYRVVRVQNESQQYRDVMSRLSPAQKSALVAQHGNLRRAFQSQTFADVRLTVVDHNQQTLEVDVEYGQYQNSRMSKKVAGFTGNMVYVVGSRVAIARYQKSFGRGCRAHFRTITV